MIYRVEVSTKPEFPDARGEAIRQQAGALGVENLHAVAVTDLYFLQGDLDEPTVQRLVNALLHDPVVEQATWQPIPSSGGLPSAVGGHSLWHIEVTLLPGVTDSVAESLLEGSHLLGLTGLAAAATGKRYTLAGPLDEPTARRIADRLLVNEVIQTYTLNQFIAPPFIQSHPDPDGTVQVEIIPLTEATETELEQLSAARRLSLDLAEMQAIQSYYRQEGREPSDVELEMLAQTWSEHCVHKTFKAFIIYEAQEDRGPGTRDREISSDAGLPSPVSGLSSEIDGLLNTYIRAATERVNKPWVRSAFVDNAGVIAFDDNFDLAFKVETHNHPSALEPFGGANTGVGGVVRDIIGVSARPIANTDVLCFGPPDLPLADLPAGVLHPRRIAAGVTAGIEDYGNKMGIPTVNGAVLYDPGYTANPLVIHLLL